MKEKKKVQEKRKKLKGEERKKDTNKIVPVIMVASLIVSILLLAYRVDQDRKEMEYSNFIKVLEYKDYIRERRKEIWLEKKEELLKTPENKTEDVDELEILDYLSLKLKEDESMDITDLRLLEIEIRSLNLLDELCRMSIEDERMERLLKLTNSSLIAYYQQKIDNLLEIYEEARKIAIFSKPKYEYLQNFDITAFIDL